MNTFNFNDLFVFDLANNHQGDGAHARGIIEAVGGVVKQRGVRGALCNEIEAPQSGQQLPACFLLLAVHVINGTALVY